MSSSRASSIASLPEVRLPPELARRFRPVRVLGRGGMGVVMEVVGIATGRRLALKLLTERGSPEARARFIREGVSLRSVSHENVVAVVDQDLSGARPYMLVELMEGGSLRDRLQVQPRLAPAEAMAIAMDCLAGLHACHSRGVVHRDVKPGNILLDREGRAKLADFGIAQEYGSPASVTALGTVVGTPHYMAPEQARGQRAGPTADLYALGTMLYEMLAGRRPFQAASIVMFLEMQKCATPQPLLDLAPDVPPALAALVHQALAKSPDERPQSAAEFARRLEAIACDRSEVPASPPPVPPRSVRLRSHLAPSTHAALAPRPSLGLACGLAVLFAVLGAFARITLPVPLRMPPAERTAPRSFEVELVQAGPAATASGLVVSEEARLRAGKGFSLVGGVSGTMPLVRAVGTWEDYQQSIVTVWKGKIQRYVLEMSPEDVRGALRARPERSAPPQGNAREREVCRLAEGQLGI